MKFVFLGLALNENTMEVCIAGRGEGWAGADDLIGLLHLEVLACCEVLR